ncbi:unnamed protein product [Clonostachys rosea]|uniref:Ppx/GppA phosphatase domain-containing protein n=1 Tax=Bionectria ochroleuca TaxID=29856 RepID=A0ABY6V0V1_BIOOC|nr:unnamed protein product [Clonostachys rosea]
MSPSDIVTLDNLAEAIPKWSPDDENHLYAVVDMGSHVTAVLTGPSNGIRFSITSLAPPKTRLLAPIYSSRAGISLFDALEPSSTGELAFSQSTISTVSSTLAQFKELADLHHVPPSHVMVFATEAMRRAANSAAMLTAIAEATGGLRVQILEPSVETLFGAVMGSRSSLADVRDGALFLDLGGGSVQITWVDTSLDDYEVLAARAGNSMPFGAAKLTRVFQEGDVGVQTTESDKLKIYMQAAFDNLCSLFPKLQKIRESYERGEDAKVDVYMCGGGCRGYGSMLMHNDEISPYPITSIGSYTVTGASFKKITEMRRINDTYDGKIPGLSKRRRQQFDAISAVMEAFTAAVPNVRHVTFCKGSNRDGALMMKLPRAIRESNPLDVIADVKTGDKALFEAVASLLAKAIPPEAQLDQVPTVLNIDGLRSLFIKEIWARAGYEADSNASFSLHYAIYRDADAPGLSHLARALLGTTVAARWGSGMGPVDAQLADLLRGILKRYSKEAMFWALYIGAVANALVTILPVRPSNVEILQKSIQFDARLLKVPDEKDSIKLSISVHPNILRSVNAEELSSRFKSILKIGDKKPKKKTSVNITSLMQE